MALSTPRLVLLLTGVLLVVCGVAVGVSEALTHDRTTEDDDRRATSSGSSCAPTPAT